MLQNEIEIVAPAMDRLEALQTQSLTA